MSPQLFVGMTLAVFTGTTLASVAAKSITDWLNRRAWRKMEMRVFTEAARIQHQRDEQLESNRLARLKLIPKPKAN